MKVKSIALGMMLFAFAGAAQDQLKLERAYKVGEQDTYAMKMVATMGQMGEVTIQFKTSQKVVKTYDDGSADIESTTSDMKIVFGGQEMPSPDQAPPVVKQKFDKYGNPVGKAEGGNPMMEQMNFSRFASVFGKDGLVVGKDIPIDVKNDKTKKQEVLGTAKLDSVKDGVATLLSDLKVWTEEAEKPMKIKMTTTVDTTSAKVNSVKGTVTELPDQQGMTIDKVDFEMTREKK